MFIFVEFSSLLKKFKNICNRIFISGQISNKFLKKKKNPVLKKITEALHALLKLLIYISRNILYFIIYFQALNFLGWYFQLTSLTGHKGEQENFINYPIYKRSRFNIILIRCTYSSIFRLFSFYVSYYFLTIN